MTAKPVVLLGHVRQRALARQRQRRDAVGLVALSVDEGTDTAREYMVPPRATPVSPPRRSATSTRATTTWRPTTTTPSGASTSASSAPNRCSRRCARRSATARRSHYARSLEIGAGTGYFTLNMMRAGLIGQATCSDISPGMLSTLQANAKRLGLKVKTEPADAERLPFEDASFDLVFGHAVLHHIPDLAAGASASSRACSRPAARSLFAGEPSRYGDRLAGVPKRAAGALAPLWRRAIGARPAPPAEGGAPEAALEGFVDVHAFAPGELAHAAQSAGLRDVRVSGEELLANWFGWTNRTLEATRRPARRAVGVAPVRLPRLSAAAGARPPPAGVAAAGGDLLQPDAHGAHRLVAHRLVGDTATARGRRSPSPPEPPPAHPSRSAPPRAPVSSTPEPGPEPAPCMCSSPGMQISIIWKSVGRRQYTAAHAQPTHRGVSAVPAGHRRAADRERAAAHLRGSLPAHDRGVPGARARSSASCGCPRTSSSRSGARARSSACWSATRTGNMDIVVRGTQPFRLIERQDDLPYPAGIVEPLLDSEEELDPDTAQIARELYAELVEQATDKRSERGGAGRARRLHDGGARSSSAPTPSRSCWSCARRTPACACSSCCSGPRSSGWSSSSVPRRVPAPTARCASADPTLPAAAGGRSAELPAVRTAPGRAAPWAVLRSCRRSDTLPDSSRTR